MDVADYLFITVVGLISIGQTFALAYTVYEQGNHPAILLLAWAGGFFGTIAVMFGVDGLLS